MTSYSVNGWERDRKHEAVIIKANPFFAREVIRLQVFTKDDLTVIATSELQKDGIRRRHISIAHPNRYPTWEEIKDARYTFMPLGCMAAQLLPIITDFINIHQNCFHLYEILDPRAET